MNQSFIRFFKYISTSAERDRTDKVEHGGVLTIRPVLKGSQESRLDYSVIHYNGEEIAS